MKNHNYRMNSISFIAVVFIIFINRFFYFLIRYFNEDLLNFIQTNLQLLILQFKIYFIIILFILYFIITVILITLSSLNLD